MTRPVRLRLSRAKGFELDALSRATNGLPATRVARPSLWGNPFVIGQPSGHLFRDGGDPMPMILNLSAEQAGRMFRDACRGFLSPEMHPAGHEWVARFRARVGCSPIEWVSTLRGRNLACWCALDGAPCHADVLLELATERAS